MPNTAQMVVCGKGFDKLTPGLSPCADQTTSYEHLRHQKWFGVGHRSPLPLQAGEKTLFIKVFNSSGPKQAGLREGKHGRVLLHHLFLPRHLGYSSSVTDSWGCSRSHSSGQEELCKACELKDSCTAPGCAMLGAYLSLDRCILILSLLF